MPTPEAVARQHIDDLLAACGWIVQDRAALNLYAGRGVVVRSACVYGLFLRIYGLAGGT